MSNENITKRQIGSIGSYYGQGLFIKSEGDRYFWMVDDPAMTDNWEEISHALFDELNRFEDARQRVAANAVAAADYAELELRAAAHGMKLVKA